MTPTDNPIDFAVESRDSQTLEMVTDAVKHENALLAFQPVVQSDNSTKVAFHEGLIRVLDSTGRIIPAGDFMGVVKNTELGRELDTLSLRLGCRMLTEVPDLRLSLNMSARSIGYAPWNEALAAALKGDDTVGSRLILEINEASAMMVPELVVGFMNRLQSEGICFALDNFGAGYSELRHFKDFFFDIVKIDGQFIKNVANDVDNQVMTETLALIGKQFDMLVVAERVERQEDANVLHSLGVDCMQGFCFGAPSTKPNWLPKRYGLAGNM